ncbi:SCO family protein [Sphingobacterium psychroaquaticum]|uniref:SCO family protein n=1 Tax=Sphingobacterium psychroaquaticum TaxID=561061 RepID=UPI00106CEA5A|nr:SCO family protein [Sphingobacterium psychroaquaticum]QBQ41789.1 SCO family protein [Sphingobacterium psychroaquaticum]
MNKVLLLLMAISFASCQENKLPYLGTASTQGDTTIYPTIDSFTMLNQDSMEVSSNSLRNKIHVASFIFLSCPTICPEMSAQMKEVQEKTQSMDEVLLLSYSIDPKRDTIPALKAYAKKIGAKGNKWHFLYGNQEEVMRLADKSYYAIAYPDSLAPGGFTHSGGLLLVDKDLHIRGVYDGTSNEETKRLLKDIAILKKEK